VTGLFPYGGGGRVGARGVAESMYSDLFIIGGEDGKDQVVSVEFGLYVFTLSVLSHDLSLYI